MSIATAPFEVEGTKELVRQHIEAGECEPVSVVLVVSAGQHAGYRDRPLKTAVIVRVVLGAGMWEWWRRYLGPHHLITL